jgi:hypothetical protein
MFPADGNMPRAGTVARELRDRIYNGVSYPEGDILDCNPTAYAKEEQLIRTLREQLKDLPKPLMRCALKSYHAMCIEVWHCYIK